MEWIPITEQPIPKDGKNIMVTIVNGVYFPFVDNICFFRLHADEDPKWWYSFTDELCEVSERTLGNITAWMYYPEPYEG